MEKGRDLFDRPVENPDESGRGRGREQVGNGEKTGGIFYDIYEQTNNRARKTTDIVNDEQDED